MHQCNQSRRAILAAGSALPMLNALPAFAQEAQPAGTTALADFFRFPQMNSVQIAPGGERICAIRIVKGRKALMTLELATMKPLIITDFKESDVVNARWISPTRLVFSLLDFERGSGNQMGPGLFAINHDSTGFRPLVARAGGADTSMKMMSAHVSYFQRWNPNGEYSDEIIVIESSLQAQGRMSSHLYRLNTKTGDSTLLTMGAPSGTIDWTVDHQCVARVAMTTDETRTLVHYRAGEQAPWTLIRQFNNDEPQKMIQPLRFDSKGNLYVSAYGADDAMAIYTFDGATGKLSDAPVFKAPGFDLEGGLLIDQGSGELLGVRFQADRTRTVWVDAEVDALQKTIDRALPDAVNVISGDLKRADATLLINSYSDRESGRFLLMQRANGKITQVGQSRPWIDSKRMARTQFYRYPARDGLSIPANLTLPPNAGGKNLPLVVLHYGGPWVRPIDWHWDPVVQFLASRGYAVFMPAPRASRGFGWTLFHSGWKQWGLAMQDDVTDGVQDLIKRGVVDPKRVCIAGASYGGYLTMMGLVKEPQLYRCGINWVGVTDPEFMFSVTWSDFNEIDAGRFTMPILIGDPDKDADQFKRTSPLKRAGEIKQPVLMAYGGLDRRVPIINGESMRDALKKNGSPPEWVVYADEGHGWLKEENNVDFWSRVETFLSKNLAPA